jgi:hypothetical protein
MLASWLPLGAAANAGLAYDRPSALSAVLDHTLIEPSLNDTPRQRGLLAHADAPQQQNVGFA